jgi:predicted CxxxxCH...CXXCH cytochrome family protein
VASPGVYGVTFNVTVHLPIEGTVTSTDGQIFCGTAPGATRCGPAPFAWNVQATLVATADPGMMLGTWAADCGGRPTNDAGQYVCVLDTKVDGSDKYVLAIFGPQGVVQHADFTSPQVHGPEFLNFVAGAKDAFQCDANACHGPTYNGAGIAPSCNACHALPASGGWVAWQSNCTFCHGTRTPTYGPESLGLASPPDAVSERLDGKPAPARTGRHRSHLAGKPAFPSFACATCHAVPTTVSHIRVDRRAPVAFDAAAAFPGLGAADLAVLPIPLAVYDPSASPPTCAASYCHGATLPGAPAYVLASPPSWSSLEPAVNDCIACHGAPPETGRTIAADALYCDADCSIHVWHVQALPVLGFESCDACHHGSALPDGAALHVNGRVDVAWSPGTTGAWDPAAGTCAVSCHSDAAPRSWR